MAVEVSIRADKEMRDGDQVRIKFSVRFVHQDGVTGLRDFSTDVREVVKKHGYFTVRLTVGHNVLVRGAFSKLVFHDNQ